MRQVFTLFCPKCKFTKVVAIGEDKNPEDKIERVKAQIKSGIYGDDIRHFYTDHPQSAIEARHALYRCNRCGHLEEKLFVRLVYNNADFTLRHKCDECNARMAPLESLGEAVCQKCKIPLQATEIPDI